MSGKSITIRGYELLDKALKSSTSTVEEIVAITKKLVEDHPDKFGLDEFGHPGSGRADLIKCLVAYGLNSNDIRSATGAKYETILKYRRQMEMEKMDTSLTAIEKYPHLKSSEIIEKFNNYLAVKLKNNIDTLHERLSEKLEDEETLHKTSIKDLAVSASVLSDSYRKTTGQDKQVVDINHNITMFPDSPLNILKNYRPKEIIADGKVIEDLPHVDPLINELPEEFRDEV